MNLWVHLVAVVFAVGVITTFDAKEVKEVECKDILRCKGPRKQKSKCKEDWAKIACKKTCGLCTSEQQTTTTTPPPPPTTAPPTTITSENCFLGIRVGRGRDWASMGLGNHDYQNGKPGFGTVRNCSQYGYDGLAYVTWDNGDSFDYYIGYDGKYQLNLANEQGIKDCFYYGEKVQIDKSLEHLAWQTADCATLTLTICSDNSRYHSIVFDNGYQNNYRYVDLQQCGNDDCADTNKGLTDKDGNGCEAYINSPSLCGIYDGNEGFVANQMCCACGGGKEIEGQTCQDSGNLDCAWVERKGKCGTYGHRCKKTCNLCAACLGIYSIDNYPCAQFTQASTCKDRMPDCAWYIAGCNDSFPEPYRSAHPNYNCAKIAKRGWCDFTWKYIFTQMLGKNDRKINEDCKKSCSNCGV